MILEVFSTSKSSGFFGPFYVLFYDFCHFGLTVGLKESSEAMVTISNAFKGLNHSCFILYETLSLLSMGVQLDYNLKASYFFLYQIKFLILERLVSSKKYDKNLI